MVASNPPTNQLQHQRCFNHAEREAAASCRRCLRDFCRECVTFLEGKMICSRCLAAETGAPEATKRYLARVAEPIGLVAGFLILWLLVAGSGKLMTAIPDPVHDASIWEEFISDQ